MNTLGSNPATIVYSKIKGVDVIWPPKNPASGQPFDSVIVSSALTVTGDKYGKKGSLTIRKGTSVYFQKDVAIQDNATIIIEEGVTLYFEYLKNYKVGGKAGLKIGPSGNIEVHGTYHHPVKFTSARRLFPSAWVMDKAGKSKKKAINGDWSGIKIDSSTISDPATTHTLSNSGNVLRYAIIEYTWIGIETMKADMVMDHCIVRWAAAEGIYTEESNILFSHCVMYQCANHKIAMEQESKRIFIQHCLFHSGNTAVSFMNGDPKFGSVHITDCVFWPYKDWHVVAIQSKGIAEGNRFYLIGLPGGKITQLEYDRTYKNEGSPNFLLPASLPELNIHPGNSTSLNRFLKTFTAKPYYPPGLPKDAFNDELGYLPGDKTKDLYPYVYSNVDCTRSFQDNSRCGKGLSIAWALTYRIDRQRLARFGNNAFVEISPPALSQKGKIIKPEQQFHYRAKGFEPPIQGLAWDGRFYWGVDRDNSRLYRFFVRPFNFAEMQSGIAYETYSDPITGKDRFYDGTIQYAEHYYAPEKSIMKGIACDGRFLYLRTQYNSSWLRRYWIPPAPKMTGMFPVLVGKPKLLGSAWGQAIKLDSNYELIDVFTWAGSSFWANCSGNGTRGIINFLANGQVVASIYPVAESTWGMAWDGHNLWTQQSYEIYQLEPKIFKIKLGPCSSMVLQKPYQRAPIPIGPTLPEQYAHDGSLTPQQFAQLTQPMREYHTAGPRQVSLQAAAGINTVETVTSAGQPVAQAGEIDNGPKTVDAFHQSQAVVKEVDLTGRG